jgi:hypothetical protein
MKHFFNSAVRFVAGAVAVLCMVAFAGHRHANAAAEWPRRHIEPLFPHTPGDRWVYALSGKYYASGGELRAEVKGIQEIAHLKQDALLVDEVYAAEASEAASDVVPVLYYPHDEYLVRDTSHIYSNPQRTSLVSTGNLGEAVTPVLPLRPDNDGTGWRPVGGEHWGKASRLSLTYRLHPERETVSVKGGEYKDCARIEGIIDRGEGSGYRYQEWYAPGVGLIKSTTTDLQRGTVLLHKELVSFSPAPTKEHKDRGVNDPTG